MYYVHPEAKIGNNVTIGNFTNIYENVEIGDNCEIAGNVGRRHTPTLATAPRCVSVSLSTEAQPPRVRLLSGAIALLWLTTTWRMIA